MASDPNFQDYNRLRLQFIEGGNPDVVNVVVRTQDTETKRLSIKNFTITRTSTIEDLKDQLVWGDAYTDSELRFILKLSKDYLSSNQPENSKSEKRVPPPPYDPNQPPNKARGGAVMLGKGKHRGFRR